MTINRLYHQTCHFRNLEIFDRRVVQAARLSVQAGSLHYTFRAMLELTRNKITQGINSTNETRRDPNLKSLTLEVDWQDRGRDLPVLGAELPDGWLGNYS